jgi:hypothetical protein
MIMSSKFEPMKYPDNWPEPSRAEIFLRWIPVAGWIPAALLERARIEPIADALNSQLKGRSEGFDHWHGELRRRVATAIIDSCVKACCWPNAHFIPDDSFEVMMEGRTGDGCEIDALVRIEKSLGIRLSKPDVQELASLTLGGAVENLARRLEARGERE